MVQLQQAYYNLKKLNKLNALYFMSSIKKVILSKYSYNAKATKIELKNALISLPSSKAFRYMLTWKCL